MATEAPNWYVQKYIDRVVTVFQQKGHKLRGMFTEPARVNGNVVNWMIAGKGEAVPLARGSHGSAMNAARSTLSATMADWQAADWYYEADIEKMTANEAQAVSDACAMAIGRRADLIPIGVMNAASLTLLDAGLGNPFTLAQALAGIETLENNDVDISDGDVYCGLAPLQWQQFMSYRQVNDADWVGYDGLPYKTGQRMKQWNGVRWFQWPIGYAPVNVTNGLDAFLWSKKAVGSAINYEPRTTVTWENIYSGWYHNSRYSATAQVLLPPGIIRLRSYSNSAITIN